MLVVIAVIAVAVIVAVAVDGNNAAAFPTGWAGGCGGSCHGVATHDAGPTHQAAVTANNCTACHTAAGGDTPDAGKCAGCHGGVEVLANAAAHGDSCVGTECHAAVTTTTAATTTTTAATTTTTTAGTTTTTAPATTTTTLPTGTLPVTG